MTAGATTALLTRVRRLVPVRTTTLDAATRAALVGFLRRPRFEVLPLPGTEERVVGALPTDVRVTVTASPAKGLNATFDVAERLAAHGFRVVPHVSARLVRDRGHLEEIVARLEGAGVREIFVPAGDAQEPGAFAGSAELLRAMGDLRERFEAIGITGYPESHHLISDEDTIRAMFEKAPMATEIVSQVCFDGEVIRDWIANVRTRGTSLPIWIGVPGMVDQAKLLRISLKIGLGESARFLKNHKGWIGRVATRRFTPDAIIRDLGPALADPAANLAGFHVYTFNEVEQSERWRRELLERLGAG